MARQEKYADKNPVVSFVIGRFFERLRGVLGELRPCTVLDAGCGEGEMLRRNVLPDGLRPVCLDLRTESLADVAETKRVCASVQTLPFAARLLFHPLRAWPARSLLLDYLRYRPMGCMT